MPHVATAISDERHDSPLVGLLYWQQRADGIALTPPVSGGWCYCSRHMAGKICGQERFSMIITAGLPTGSKRPVNCRPPDAALMRKEVIESPF